MGTNPLEMQLFHVVIRNAMGIVVPDSLTARSGTVVFTRGQNFIGGPDPVFSERCRPLGLFLKQPDPVSHRGAYVCGSGSCVGVLVYEDSDWSYGDFCYASKNGLLTNRVADAYEQTNPTIIGVVKAAPTLTLPLLLIDMRI